MQCRDSIPSLRLRKSRLKIHGSPTRFGKKIRQRKAIFKRHGRSKAWKRLKKIINKMIKFRREEYIDRHKILITSPDACRHFFRNVRTYNSSEKPQIWDIKSIRPNLSDADLAIKLSEYFTTISNEFLPLNSSEIPVSFPRELPILRPYQVSERIRRIKKPRSKIRGDIFPNLMTEYSDLLAQPLCDIYNTITETLTWPVV